MGGCLCERLEDPDAAGALAVSMFEELGGRQWRIDAYFEDEPEPAMLLAALAGEDLVSGPAIEPVPDENWVAISQAALPPVEAARFIVHGSHDRGAVGRRQWSLEIEAGEAFGTAHHATTEGCLLALDRLARRREFSRILDLGCGSGVLAIAASRLWPSARVLASDIDPVAVEVARVNTRLNRAGSRVGTLVARGLRHAELWSTRRFDLVVANILAGPLIRLAPTLARRIAPWGVLVLSGVLAEQAREVCAVYRQAGFHCARCTIRLGWATIELERRPHR